MLRSVPRYWLKKKLVLSATSVLNTRDNGGGNTRARIWREWEAPLAQEHAPESTKFRRVRSDGLSPRGRGNHDDALHRPVYRRSIPAWSIAPAASLVDDGYGRYTATFGMYIRL